MNTDPAFHFPDSLLTSIQTIYPVNTDELVDAHHSTPSVSVRVNPFKPCDSFNTHTKVAWCEKAYYLPERISFIKDPLFHAGCYYVQEASSMFLESAIKQTTDLTQEIRVLDLCASPGGKSTLINSLISDNSILVSNEVIKTRIGALAENLSKWGRANVIVSNNDPKDFAKPEAYFDVIVVDAPCSGSGLFRKQEDAIDHWSEENVTHCSQRQERILDDVLPALKPGGILIYSTCSYSPQENENIAGWLKTEKGLESIRLTINAEDGIVETAANEVYGYRFFPHLTKGEGFFLAAFRKTDGEEHSAHYKKHTFEKITKEESTIVESFLHMSDSLKIIRQKENFFLINTAIERDYELLHQCLHIRKKGTLLGEIKGKDFVPHHELALSVHLNKNVASAEVSAETALKFLKKSDFRLDADQPKGFCVIRYQQHAIGWVKNLGNRINNYLPKEWRILMDIGI